MFFCFAYVETKFFCVCEKEDPGCRQLLVQDHDDHFDC